MATLTSAALEAAKAGSTAPVTLRVSNVVKLPNGKFYSCTLSDTSASMKGRLIASASKALTDGSISLSDGDIITTESYVCNEVGSEWMILVSDLALTAAAAAAATTKASAAAAAANAGGPLGGDDDAAGRNDQGPPPSTPLGAGRGGGAAAAAAATAADGAGQLPAAAAAAAAASTALTPGPTPSPSEELHSGVGTPMTTARPFSTSGVAAGAGGNARSGGGGGAATPGGAGPPMPSPLAVAAAGNRRVHPIAALNPYDTQWCIKAKVMRIGPVRSFTGRGGAPNRMFNLELADAEGGQIQATLWREAVDRYLDALQEGKVYYFSKFNVKPANKQYATLRNDYEVAMDGRTEVELAEDQGGISDATPVDVVPLEKLPRHVGRKAPVDVLGVVLSVGPLGTIKRRADNSELQRRDVTIGDASRSSVVLTLWSDHAALPALDAAEGRLMQVTCVRVGDYNGCSLSAVSRSQVTIDPSSAEADALRSWYDAEGRPAAATFTPLGGGAAAGGGAGGAGGASGRANRLQVLGDVLVTEDLPAPDAKPTYHDVVVTVLQVREDQTLYYLADPSSGKKVEPRDGRYWCEGEQRYIESAAHRYVLSARVADASAETHVSMFDEQGAQLLRCSADELAAARSTDESAAGRTLRSAQWGEWAMTLAARSREYNGERRMRYTVVRMAPLDYAVEGHRLLQLITAGSTTAEVPIKRE